MEAEAFLAAMKGLKLADGRDRLVRHGHGPERTIQTGIGPVEVERVKIRDRGVAADGERVRFTSAILPLWARRTRSLDALLPVLYLRGISTGDFQEALAALLGKDAPNLSPAVISRLTAEWQGEYERWQKRNLSARRYVYVWADGVFLQARMEDHGECMLVLIGATPEGKKELIGFQVGVRESAQSWRELLIETKSRGLKIAPEIAVGDGALGFWKALDEIFPATRHQRCWVHKTANILNKVALSVQTNMKKDLREVYLAPNRRVPDERPRRAACALRLPRRALGPLADDESHRKRVRDGAAQDGAHERLVVINHCQVDGVQAALRRIEDLAAAERHKSVAEGRRRCQI
jgi:transposase-like protein